MTKLIGKFYEPRSSRPTDGVISLVGEQICLTKDGERSPTILTLQDIQGEDNLYFEDGSYFHCDGPIPEDFRARFQSKGAKAVRWLENWTWWKVSVYAVALVAFILVARLSLIAGLDLLTYYFPDKWEQFLGQQSYAVMQKAVLEETTLPVEKQIRFLAMAKRAETKAGLPKDIQILFHSSPDLGPNAFAFPGGPIVVTDQLVNLLKSNEQVFAVIAHEYGHVQKRHSLRQLIKFMGVTGLATLIFGGNESFLEEILAVGIDLWALDNSRAHEREADMYALEVMRKSGHDPRHMLEGMKVLLASTCGSKKSTNVEKCLQSGATGWLDTHPGSKERLEYLSKAIGQ